MPMTDQEVLDELRSKSLRNAVRQKMRHHAGRTEQATQQRRPPSPVAMRRMEFEGADEIIEMVLAEERARIRRELLAATTRGLEEGHMRALLNRICPEE